MCSVLVHDKTKFDDLCTALAGNCLYSFYSLVITYRKQDARLGLHEKTKSTEAKTRKIITAKYASGRRESHWCWVSAPLIEKKSCFRTKRNPTLSV